MNVSQILCNSAYGASVYVLCAIGFALIYRTARFFNFAHGFSIISGPYAAYVLRSWAQLPLSLACLGGVLIAGGIGCLLELTLFRPMRTRNATPLTLLLASLGAYVVLQNMISLLFGDHTRILRNAGEPFISEIVGIRVTGMQVLTVCVSIASVIGLHLFLRQTLAGKAIRAVSDDFELADVCGINSNKVMLIVIGVGSAFAGLAGILVSLDVDLTPSMGLPYLMMAVVVTIIGGRRSVTGLLLGAFFLSLAQNIGTWYVGAQWGDAIAFSVLLVFLVGRIQRLRRAGRTISSSGA